MPARALHGGVRHQPVDGHRRPGRRRAGRQAVGAAARDADRPRATRCTCSPPEPGLPDMVYAANGAFIVDGTAYGARFRYPQRTAEAAAHRGVLRARTAGGSSSRPRSTRARATSRTCPGAYGGLILGRVRLPHRPGRARRRRRRRCGRPVVSLQLVDPRFYHLDVALAALDDRTRRVLPRRRSRPASQRVLRAALPGRGARRRGRRAGVRPQPGRRRTARGAQQPRRPGWPTRSPQPATCPSPSSLPS